MGEYIAKPVLDNVNACQARERLDEIIEETDEYNGFLPETWEATVKTADITEHGGKEEISVDLDQYQGKQIETLVSSVANIGASRVVIEAAHLYEDESTEDRDTIEVIEPQLRFASTLRDALNAEDVSVAEVLFIDNYNGTHDSTDEAVPLDIEKFIEIAYQFGYDPEYVLFEADMVELAREIIAYMQNDQGLVAEKETEIEGGLYLQRRNVELYRYGDDKVTCAMLDTALTIVKLRYLGDAVINILPRRPENSEFSYNSQQRNMRTILGQHLSLRSVPVFNLYVDGTTKDSIAAGRQNQYRKDRI